MNSLALKSIRIGGFIFTLFIWNMVLSRKLDQTTLVLILVIPVLLVFPVVRTARIITERQPSPGGLAWTTSALHIILMIFFGAAVSASVRIFNFWSDGILALPPAVGLVLLYITGFLLALTVLNLAVNGLGAPFAIALSRRVASRWLYAYTRNPMVLFTLAVLVSAGLYYQSLVYICWVLLLVTPAFIYFLKVYEEHELERRFGESYTMYKAKTPFLIPRKQEPN